VQIKLIYKGGLTGGDCLGIVREFVQQLFIKAGVTSLNFPAFLSNVDF
jgi:hypothetical protein